MENNSINNTSENIENYINKLNILIIDNLKSICSSKTISELDNKELATIFEYYTAIKLIQKTNKNFTLYSKLTPVQKEKLQEKDLPTRDIGCDGIDTETYTDLFQSKLYGKNNYISVTDIANFFTHKFYSNQPENIKLHLYRTVDSKINTESRKLIKNNHITDEQVDRIEFINYLENLINTYDNSNTQLSAIIRIIRDYQETAINILHKNNKCILSIPTGCGKTLITLEYINDVFREYKKQNINTTKFLVLVPTIVLLEQWHEESVSYNFNIFLLGTNYNNNITLKNIKENNLFICVYNSVEHILPFLQFFEKLIVDEAHRIYKPAIYKKENKDEEYSDIDSNDDTNSDIDNEDIDINNIIDSDTNNDIDSIVSNITDDKYTTLINQIINNPKQNIALLSATIDNYDKFTYYSYGIREAIDNGHLSDYQIVCPIFNDDPTDKNIAEYIINKKNELHCIVFTSNRKIGLNFCNLLNNIKPNCAQFIDCHTSKNDRKNIINSFNNGEIQFLVNVRILTEGFNSPICSSVMFLHLPSNDTFILQAIGRSLRLHESKIISNIYLPFNTDSDIKDISNFIYTLSKNDEKIGLNYRSKNIGTYINIEKDTSVKSNKKEEINNEDIKNIEYKYDLILNNFILKYTPEEKAQLLLDYITKNKKVPSQKEPIIGKFWSAIKGLRKRNKIIYETILSKNPILKADYDLAQQNREEAETKEKYTPEEKAKLLLNYVKIHKKIPEYSEPIIGSFWSNIKGLKKRNKIIYETILSKNPILKADYDLAQQNREEAETKEKYTPEEKAKLLLKYVKKYNKVPSKKEPVIGNFWANIKNKNKCHKELYKILLSKNAILKADYDRLQQEREDKR